MIQIDMLMPENCRMCPACSEYDICLIPIDGKGFGEQNVSEFIDSRPEWCPLKEQEAVVHCGDCENFCFDNISPNAGRCTLTNKSHSKTWFCADGERREDDA